jgi:tetratricopeptide (TPR) repeat protein
MNSNTARFHNASNASKTIQRLWFAKGKVLTKQGYYEAALTSFDAALKIQPDHCKSWVFRGIVLTHLEQYKSALASLDRALELSPSQREAWIFRGAVLKYLGRHDEALASYSKALTLQQADVELCNEYPLWLPAEKAALPVEV